jgi:hypothetical protein
VNFRLSKIDQLSGREASIYTIMLDGDENSVFEKFLQENKDIYGTELKNILTRLTAIGHTVGARSHFFKEKEGKPGDLVCALYDDPDAKLRLYCIRYGQSTIVLGGGAAKPKDIRAWQDDPKLAKYANMMIKASDQIAKKIKDRDLYWCTHYRDLLGEMEFNDGED